MTDFRRAERALLGLVLAGAALLDWSQRFVCDDAYISWRYARNFVNGAGLVWNAGGVGIEGYTNFVWTLLAAVPIALGLSVETFMNVLGILSAVGSLALFHCLLRTLSVHRWTALLATVTLGLFASFIWFATGGLETSFQTFLCLAVSWLCFSKPKMTLRRSATLGILVALALGTRLDSVLLIAPPLIALTVHLYRVEGPNGLRRLLPAADFVLVLVGSWFAWKLGFYGSLFPNTLRAKVDIAPASLAQRGVVYLLAFARSYRFVLPLVFLPIGVWRSVAPETDHRLEQELSERHDQRISRSSVALTLLTASLLWLAYLVRVGGDFMEFRMLVPILPGVFALAYAGARDGLLAVLLAANIVYGSWHHFERYDAEIRALNGPEPVSSMAWHLGDPGDHWVDIGQRLQEAFRGDVNPSIAVTAAGAIPFYSQLPTVDMLGLNDPDLDRFLVRTRMSVGHERLIPLDLLRDRGVTFLIGHPLTSERRARGRTEPFTFADFVRPGLFLFPNEAELRGDDVVEMPLASGRVLLMIYLTPSQKVDARLNQLGWRRYPLR